MLGPWVFLGCVWASLALAFAAMWYVCNRIGNAGYVDVAWAFMISVGIILASFVLETESGRGPLVALMGAVWGLRLAWHLFDRIHGHEEDGRYAHMREAFGDKAPLAFFLFFQLQAIFVVLFLAPMVAAMTIQGPMGWREIVAAVIWMTAIQGESTADRQLARFKSNPENKGAVCKRGLWRYSRHPNYFFEWVHWFAYLVIGVRLSESIGYAALLGPVVMLVFLLFVTGVPYTEQRAVRSKGEAYRQYQRETSAFIPWFPRKVGKA